MRLLHKLVTGAVSDVLRPAWARRRGLSVGFCLGSTAGLLANLIQVVPGQGLSTDKGQRSCLLIPEESILFGLTADTVRERLCVACKSWKAQRSGHGEKEVPKHRSFSLWLSRNTWLLRTTVYLIQRGCQVARDLLDYLCFGPASTRHDNLDVISVPTKQHVLRRRAP